MRDLAITAVGRDRPGIVAGLTEALYAVGANMQDCRAALLRGSFAIVMAVSVPDDVDAQAATAALRPAADELGLTLWIGETAADPGVGSGAHCVVSVYGADHPGIVSAVTRVLADRGVNIEDLSSRIVGDPPVYVLGIECELPEGMTALALHAHLAPVASAQRVELSVAASADEVI